MEASWRALSNILTLIWLISTKDEQSSEEGDPEKENEKEDLEAELNALLEESTADLPQDLVEGKHRIM